MEPVDLNTHLDVETLQHRHTEGGRLSCSRLRPEQIREQLLDNMMEVYRTPAALRSVPEVLLGDDVSAFDDLFDGSLLDGRRLLKT